MAHEAKEAFSAEVSDAIFGARQYLLLAPNSADAGWLQQHVSLMERRLMRLN